MKKYLSITFLSAATIFGLQTPAVAQTVNPIGMRYTGSQQYIGQNTTVVNPMMQHQQYVAPQINSIYAQPMNRVNEIPLYGKNKNLYFYNQKKKDEGPLSGSGLYIFAEFSTGKTNNGINIENGEADNGEADANKDMGTANGITLGAGRVMSNDLNVEFMYSSYTGMKYGDWVKFYEEETIQDDEGNDITETVVNDSTYEVVSGGNITSQFIGFGFKYNLEGMFGILLGRLKPYFGFQIGIAENTIKDFTVSDPDGYYGNYAIPDVNSTDFDENEDIPADCYGNGSNICTAEEYTNGTLDFIGTTNRSIAGSLEAGFTVELEGNLSIDFFYKYNHFGKVKTSGNILSTYDLNETDFYVTEDANCISGYTESSVSNTYTVCTSDTFTTEDEQSLTQRRVQSGDMNFSQYGIKLRYMF